MSSYRTESTVT